MSLKKSVVYTAINPRAEIDINTFSDGIRTLQSKGISVIEFHSPLNDIPSRGELLTKQKIEHIFLMAARQKRYNLNLSSLNEDLRMYSVQETKKYIDAAADAGASSVLLTSGSLPNDSNQVNRAIESLEKSLLRLCDYAATKNIGLTLEPGDRNVQAKQVIGPTPLAVELCERLHLKGRKLSLTMDTSHLAQLGEDVFSALELAKPWCSHIHLANCILKQGHPLYGDMHPPFAEPDGYFTLHELQTLGEWCKALYANNELTLSFEIICPETSDTGFFERILQEEEWFFSL